MTGQDVALLLTLQLAILTAAALCVHTAYVAGYERGRQDGNPFTGMARFMRKAAERLQRQLATWQPQLMARSDAVDAMAYAARAHYGATVQDPPAATKLTDTQA